MSLPSLQVSQSPEEKFREFLASRPRPQRFTGQQRDLVQHIFARHHHFTTEQLIRDLQSANLNISRATVYRTLSKLVDAGLLRKLEMGADTYYDHDYGYPQHEHLVCEHCKRLIEFQDPAIEEAIRAVSEANQFQFSGHTLIVRGVCVDCNRARATKRMLDLI
ncbi:MAG: transcriptional repressor [Planctomycetes bacterium]|nr:transcriptional repressor [Planctomycetota bacterium]